MPLFKALGTLLALYVVYALATGRVYAKHRWWGRSWERDTDPLPYWTGIAVYGGLSVALWFVF